ncbi:hypothetical protein ACN27F_28335 [Solwaraspora sp. WMMB335]|uniref:hypothetical protein n=1 Tax=Solwaraspora sp. WMMB335 TaxID=3404118 RepID=UPI003B945360
MVLHQFLLDVPQAAAIWTGLLLLAIAAMAGLIVRTRPEPGPPVEHPSADASPTVTQATGLPRSTVARWLADVRDRMRRRGRLAAQARDARRYAEEVAVATERAERTARRRYGEWLAALAEVDAAWLAFDEADTTLRRSAAAAVLPPPVTARTPAEYADRERHLHRVAMAAYWRRALTVRQLTDALAHRNGWDPCRHPIEQELVLQTVIRNSQCARYLAAAGRERLAWQTAEAARTAAGSLRTEASVAACEAHRLRRWLPRAERAPVAADAEVTATGSWPAVSARPGW